MKACTDIEQSKKLAEILPVESADMKWYFWKDEIDAPKTPTFGYSKDAAESFKDTVEAVYLPCWSLAALLNILPVGTETHKQTYDSIECYYVEVYNKGNYFCTDRHVNLLDACVKMILVLHKLKMFRL